MRIDAVSLSLSLAGALWRATLIYTIYTNLLIY
jgi:hypothetical protein